ncbi:MAG: threonine synthase, partial [Armatimonadota bacterium]
SVAGVAKLVGEGYFEREAEAGMPDDASVVCILTGHGLKDPDRAIATAEEPAVVEPETEKVVEVLGLREVVEAVA